MIVAIWTIIVVSIGVICAVGITHRIARTRGFSDDFSDSHVVDVASGRLAWPVICFAGLALAGAVTIELFSEPIRWTVLSILLGVSGFLLSSAVWLVLGFLREDKAVQASRENERSSAGSRAQFRLHS